MTPFILLSYLISAAVTGFALSRPSSAWLRADRDKSWWVSFMVVMTIFGPVGLIAVTAFIVGVLPRMHANRESQTSEPYESNPFRKR